MSTTETNETKEVEYNFGIGHPCHTLNLSKEMIAKCFKQHLEIENDNYYIESTDYGLYEGSWYFRSNLADWLNKLYSLNKQKQEELKDIEQVYGTNLCLTTGASQSMELLLIHLKRLKNKLNKQCKNIILVEDPSYYLFPDIAETAGCKLLPISFTNNNRLDFEYLEQVLIKYSSDIICIYCIPTHQNPLGISYSMTDRIKLVKLCHKYKLHLIADEVYNLLSFDNDVIMVPFISSIEQTLYSPKDVIMVPFTSSATSSIEQTLAFNDVVIEEESKGDNDKEDEEEITYFCHSVSSFSKIIGPGFRIGWIYTNNQNLLQSIMDHGSIKSGGCMTQFMPTILR